MAWDMKSGHLRPRGRVHHHIASLGAAVAPSLEWPRPAMQAGRSSQAIGWRAGCEGRGAPQKGTVCSYGL